jgi:ubiquinone/menaquinone biosynthesis C-methylase UbiE
VRLARIEIQRRTQARDAFMSDNSETLSIAQQQFRRRSSAYAMVPTSVESKFMAFMVSISGAGKSDSVLDVACGDGYSTLAFAERCGRTIGIDVVAEPLARARGEGSNRGIGNADFAVSELERFAFADCAFTGVVCRFSFHHFVRPDRVFTEMARVLAPGGWMVVADMTASEDPEKANLHNQLERLCDSTHARMLPVSEFERMFADCGFRVAMKVARETRLTVDDWIKFGGATPANAAKLRDLIARAVDDDRPGLRLTREGETIRLMHTVVSFVIEKDE